MPTHYVMLFPNTGCVLGLVLIPLVIAGVVAFVVCWYKMSGRSYAVKFHDASIDEPCSANTTVVTFVPGSPPHVSLCSQPSRSVTVNYFYSCRKTLKVEDVKVSSKVSRP